jgi:Domain of unknown function (DUF4190)
MSYPPPPGGDQPPYDPNQPSYGQGGYGQAPPPGGYGQAPPGGYGPNQTHPKATTSLILGIVGIVCCSFVAPFAWTTGKKTVNEIDASGGRLEGRGQAQAGYILGIVGTVLLILGILFFILAAVTGGLSFEAGTNVD